MNQVMNIISSLFEPLTKIETYENIATKIAMIVILYYRSPHSY